MSREAELQFEQKMKEIKEKMNNIEVEYTVVCEEDERSAN